MQLKQSVLLRIQANSCRATQLVQQTSGGGHDDPGMKGLGGKINVRRAKVLISKGTNSKDALHLHAKVKFDMFSQVPRLRIFVFCGNDYSFPYTVITLLRPREDICGLEGYAKSTFLTMQVSLLPK